jgi:hypothetical protein
MTFTTPDSLIVHSVIGGVKAWDKSTGKMKFWEFDVFGGITTGEVLFDNGTIYHVYDYTDSKGNIVTLADIWIPIDKDTYTFKVCSYKDGKAGPGYMAVTYTRANR